jgi:hypothetical protein
MAEEEEELVKDDIIGPIKKRIKQYICGKCGKVITRRLVNHRAV